MVISNKVVKNASWLVVGKAIQAVLSAAITMFTARYLKPDGFGILAYASSIVIFFVPLMQLGFSNIMVQELTRHIDEDGKIIGSSIFLSIISAFACMIGIFVFVNIANADSQETIIVCSLYSTMLVFQAVELIQYWFQAKLLSKYFSVVSLITYLVVAGYELILLITQKSVYWFAVSKSIEYLILSAALIIIYIKKGGQRLSFSMDVAKRMFASSKYYIVSSLMVTIFAETDKIMIKNYIDDAATGIYSVAMTCACMTSFVFAAIIDSMRPSIFEYKKNNNQESYKKSLIILYSMIIFLSLAQGIFMTLFADIIIGILYGADYAASALTLRIGVWFTTFSYIGSVRNIWILAENKQKYLWIINLSGALMNILLNAIMIPWIGINGAAIASLITQFFTNIIISFIIRPISENNLLILKSLNPRPLTEAIKDTFHSHKA